MQLTQKLYSLRLCREIGEQSRTNCGGVPKLAGRLDYMCKLTVVSTWIDADMVSRCQRLCSAFSDLTFALRLDAHCCGVV